MDPAKPSQDFFGEITGAIGCLPNRTPATYPPMSEAIVTRMNVMMPCTPGSPRPCPLMPVPPSESSSATNEPRNGM